MVRKLGSKNRSTPLQLTWTRDPVKQLGIHFSYDEKQNNYYNSAIKIQKLQTNLDLWKSRNITLIVKVLIIKSLGLSHATCLFSFKSQCTDRFYKWYQEEALQLPLEEQKGQSQRRMFISRVRIRKGGIRMPFIEPWSHVIKALRLVWLPRHLNPSKQNWKSIPDHFFRKPGGLNFLLRCNYDPRYLDPKLSIFIEMYCRSSSK